MRKLDRFFRFEKFFLRGIRDIVNFLILRQFNNLTSVY